MTKIFNYCTIGLGAIGGFLSFYLGGYDMLLKAIIILVIIDYITGIMKSICNKSISSKIGFKGIFKKIMIFLLIATTVVIDTLIKVDTPLREFVIMFFITNEGISILENASEFIPVPEKLKNILLQIRSTHNVE